MGAEDSLAELLGQLENELAKFGAPIVGSFRPGLADSEVTDILATERLSCPDDLRTWFRWHDGAEGNTYTEDGAFDQVAENALAVGWHMMPLADALGVRRWWLKAYQASPKAELLPSSWLPLVVSNNMALNVDTASEALPLYVVGGTLPEEKSPLPQFASLYRFVHALLRLFTEQLVVPDDMLPGAAWADLDTSTDPELRRLARW